MFLKFFDKQLYTPLHWMANNHSLSTSKCLLILQEWLMVVERNNRNYRFKLLQSILKACVVFQVFSTTLKARVEQNLSVQVLASSIGPPDSATLCWAGILIPFKFSKDTFFSIWHSIWCITWYCYYPHLLSHKSLTRNNHFPDDSSWIKMQKHQNCLYHKECLDHPTI